MFNVNLCVKHISLFHTIRTLVEEKKMIVSSDKYLPSNGEMQIFRTGKKRIRNLVKYMFDVAVVRLTEVDLKLPPQDSTGIMRPAPKDPKMMDDFYTVVICFPYIYTM